MTKVNSQGSDDANVPPPDRDADLVAFLRQYAPPVPEATAGEEERLMAAIAPHQESAAHPMSTPNTSQGKTRYGDRPLPQRVAKRVGSVAGCSVLVYALWQLYQVVIPTYRPVGELAEIENFWFQNWDGVANAEDTPPWLADSDAGSDPIDHPRTPNHFYRSPSRQE